MELDAATNILGERCTAAEPRVYHTSTKNMKRVAGLSSNSVFSVQFLQPFIQRIIHSSCKCQDPLQVQTSLNNKTYFKKLIILQHEASLVCLVVGLTHL